MEGFELICSGYGAETGNDILTVRLSPEGKAEVTGGIRQGDGPSWILEKGEFLYAVSEQSGRAAIDRFRIREDGSLSEEQGRIALPGGELCHLWAGENALYGSCYGTGDFFAVDDGLREILWHRSPQAGGGVEEGSGAAEGGSGAGRPEGTGGAGCQEEWAAPHAHWVSRQDSVLYLSDLGRDRIYRYRIGGGLPEAELEPVCLPKGAGPRQVLPLGGKLLLSVQELDGTLRLWRDEGKQAPPICLQTVRATSIQGTNYPGTACLAGPDTVLVCNRGANTVAAFSIRGERLTRIGEWETGNWPRHLLFVPGPDLVINACNKEGVLNVFSWDGKRLQKRDAIALCGASCALAL